MGFSLLSIFQDLCKVYMVKGNDKMLMHKKVPEVPDDSFNLMDDSIDFKALLEEKLAAVEDCMKDPSFKEFRFVYMDEEYI